MNRSRSPKLRTIKPMVKTLPALIGRPTGEKARDTYRNANQPWRQWYQSAEWKRIRLLAFKRDRYVCQRTGEACIGKGQERNAPVANHRIPHKGDRKLFFSLSNLETVTKEVHDGLIQREEKQAQIAGIANDGSRA